MISGLSSDILQQQFGPTSLFVVFQAGDERIVQTVAGDKILELSCVRFDTIGRQQFPVVTHAIDNGASMGQAFRDAKIPFTRRTAFVSKIAASQFFKDIFTDSSPLWVVGVDVLVGGKNTPYASIVEFYNPLVVWPDPIQELTEQQRRKVKESQDLLETKLLR